MRSQTLRSGAEVLGLPFHISGVTYSSGSGVGSWREKNVGNFLYSVGSEGPLDLAGSAAGPGSWPLIPASNSIQFSVFCIGQYHKLQNCLRVLYNLYT